MAQAQSMVQVRSMARRSRVFRVDEMTSSCESTSRSGRPVQTPHRAPGWFAPAVEAEDAAASLEDNGRVRTHECRDTRRVPVGEPDAPVRLRIADAGWLRGSVQAVVFDAQVDPHDANRIIRS